MIFTTESAFGERTIHERIVIEDGPIVSDVDAMQREWSLDILQSKRRVVLGEFLKEHGSSLCPISQKEVKKHRRVVKRLDRAIEMLRGQLAVWKVHDQ